MGRKRGGEMANQDAMDIIKANQNLEAYQERINSLEAQLEELRANRFPLCPICGKQVAIICPDDLDRIRAKAEQAEKELEDERLDCDMIRKDRNNLEAQLEEQSKRAFEYHFEWESACNRERGRIEDVKDLTAQLEEANTIIARQLSFIAGQKLELEEMKDEKKLTDVIIRGTTFETVKNLQSQNTTLHGMIDEAEAQNARFRNALEKIAEDYESDDSSVNEAKVLDARIEIAKSALQLSNQGESK
jgi:flagellar biosynthesis chaperone FliJ